MASSLLAKLATAAALVTTSFLLSSCQTTAGKPVLCASGHPAKNGRCAKVAKSSQDKRTAKMLNAEY